MIRAAALTLLAACASGPKTTTSSSTPPSTSDTSTTSSPACGATVPITTLTDSCSACVESSCCTELEACEADKACAACLASNGGDTAACQASIGLVQAFVTCANTSCTDECAGTTGTYTSTISDPGQCARYCCTDLDCGGGTCDKSYLGLADVGVCVDALANAECSATDPTVGECAGSYACNPITNAGCTGKGEACDFDGYGFACYPPPNDQDVCDACDNAAGPFCKAGYTCYTP